MIGSLNKDTVETLERIAGSMPDGETAGFFRKLEDGDTFQKVLDAINPFDPQADAMRESILAMRERLNGLRGEARKRAIRELRGVLHKEHRKLEAAKRETVAKRERYQRYQAASKEVLAWWEGPLVLQRLDGPAFPKLRISAFEGMLYPTCENWESLAPDTFEPMWRDATTLVVEHDWARAFENATGIDSVATLPDDVCAFEFRISGRRVIATCFLMDDRTFYMLPAIQVSDGGWIVTGTTGIRNGVFGSWQSPTGMPMYGDDHRLGRWTAFGADEPIMKLLPLLYRNITCISVALSAQVATREIIRIPYRSNQPPGQTRPLPHFSYHVVSLAHRDRVQRAPVDPNAPPGKRKRLHFRREHDRHYPNHKVTIAWQLVGDPELGFVDKHYRL